MLRDGANAQGQSRKQSSNSAEHLDQRAQSRLRQKQTLISVYVLDVYMKKIYDILILMVHCLSCPWLSICFRH